MSASCSSSGDSDPAPRTSAEFFPGATHWPANLSRRDFLQVMGASLSLAGLSACGRPTAEKILPYVNPPEMTPSTGAAWYATAMPWQGFARGILAKSLHGRPIKIEGNPDHPESLGTTDAITQAAILSLYDPDRSGTPLLNGQPAAAGDFERAWFSHRAELAAQHGAGFALLTAPTTSPTELRQIHALLDAWPAALWFQHSALPRFDRDGTQRDFDFAQADVILSVGADCFYHHPAALRHVRAFAVRRRINHGRVNLNRFYALESTLSLTGAQADVRATLTPTRIPVVLHALVQALDGAPLSGTLTATEREFVVSFAEQLGDSTRKAVCVVGDELPADLHDWADAFNQRFGGSAVSRRPAVRSDGDARCRGGLGDLVAAMARGEISTLTTLGGNPVYTASGDLDFAAALQRIALTIHLGEYVDETAAHCRWHLPEAHFLETWSDLRAYSGAATILQPLIDPAQQKYSAAELIHFLHTGATQSAYELVRTTWRKGEPAPFEQQWSAWLQRGVIAPASDPQAATTVVTRTSDWPVLAEPASAAGSTILFRPDAHVWDGRYANNGWLQELPKPFTTLVWENAALVDASLAHDLELVNGDVIACTAGGRTVEAPVWILPGQAPGCITLPLGYGRTAAGRIGDGRGFSAAPLRLATASWQRDGVQVARTGRHQELVATQGHFTMEGRDLARAMAEAELGQPAAPAVSPASLFPPWPREGYAWGMSIDLGTCFGCSACVTACQAENNIPVVGREQVARGREMHWIRIDRYYSGADDNPRVMHQPVPCMHCENAPCEVVCPVGATVHTSEGLNDMVYNRCVGTRYCSNNCPYKVRRFNFLDYRAPAGAPSYRQSNPDVTIRERGVMEKCTYCVQRINAGRIAAEKENRRVRDGEIRTACQQACPVEAIVFGDLNDPASRVVQRKAEPASYLLLGELNTRPRTSYLAKVIPSDLALAQVEGQA